MSACRIALLALVVLSPLLVGCKGDDPQRVDAPVVTLNVVGEMGFLKWSPDGGYLAGASQADRLSVWDIESGETLFTYEFGTLLADLCWTHDGDQLVAGFGDGHLIVWEPLTGEELFNNQSEKLPWGATNSYTAIACSPGSPLVATGQTAGHLALWDSSDWEAGPRPIHEYRGAVLELVWRPDGTHVGALHGTALDIWQVEGYAVTQVLKKVTGEHLAFSPDGTSLVAGSSSGGISHWDMATGERERLSTGSMFSNHHGGRIVGMGWSPNGDLFASASDNGRIIIWEGATHDRLFFLRTPRRIESMVWSPVADGLALGGRHEIMLLDLSEILP